MVKIDQDKSPEMNSLQKHHFDAEGYKTGRYLSRLPCSAPISSNDARRGKDQSLEDITYLYTKLSFNGSNQSRLKSWTCASYRLRDSLISEMYFFSKHYVNARFT